jgi:hypothetical protein
MGLGPFRQLLQQDKCFDVQDAHKTEAWIQLLPNRYVCEQRYDAYVRHTAFHATMQAIGHAHACMYVFLQQSWPSAFLPQVAWHALSMS